MKWLFSILLIANLGLLIWLYPQREQAAATQGPLAQMGELRLVGEVPAKPAGASALQEEVESVTPDLEQQQAAKTIDAKSPVEAIPPPEVKPVPAGNVESEAAVVEAQPQCETIGVFEKRVQAELLSVQLLALGLKPEIASETSNEQAGYWVLIPPQPTRTDAIDTAKELEAAGVADLWRFTSGNLAHAISLGLFRDEERAEARKQQIAALGFAPEVRPRYRQLTKYWLIYSYTEESPVTEEKWQEFQEMFPDIENETVACP